MDDLISRQAAIEAMSESLKRVFPEHRKIAEKCLNVLPSAQPEPCDDAVSRADVVDMLEMFPFTEYSEYETAREVVKRLPSAQPEIIRCKDCENWIPGYITDNDDFIPPKCGKYQQMVGHSSDDYCSLAERRTDAD